MEASGRWERQVRDKGAFEDGTVVATARFYGKAYPFSGKVNVNVALTADVVFDESTPLAGGWALVSTVDMLIGGVKFLATEISREILGSDLGL